MPIQSLKLANVGPFRRRPDGSGSEGIELEFDAGVNLLIGPNNVGKSTILQVLAAVTARASDAVSALPRAFKNAVTDRPSAVERPKAEFRLVWLGPVGDHREFWQVLDYHLHGGDDSFGSLRIGSPDGLREVDNFAWEKLAPDFGYVGYYNPLAPKMTPAFATYPPAFNTHVWGEDDDPNVYSAVGMKLSREPVDTDIAAEIDRVILEITKRFPVKMGVGIFTDNPDSDREEWRKGQSKFETMDGELTYPELSHGTRSVFAWVSQFMLGMAEHYEADKHDNWKKMPGIFIIDEIDAHLHPSWQRRIIPTLRRHFPNVQIFASTHSPMMVAGLKAGQVHLLKRDDSGQVVWSRNEQDIVGWTADEIYRTFMGIEDPTDERTAGHAEELRKLREKDSLTAEDEKRLQELRRLVNQDLLARGALNAQQDRFDAMMQEYLRSRASDLSQEGA